MPLTTLDKSTKKENKSSLKFSKQQYLKWYKDMLVMRKIEERVGLPNSPFMELHYIKNNFFMDDNEILNNASKLKSIPGYIIQGRYDLICPPVNAYNLSQKWEGSRLTIVNTAGHSSSDEGIMENLQYSLDKLIKTI